MGKEPTKSEKRKLRELASLAHERELARELTGIEKEFGRWHRNEINAFGLLELIHIFHDGPARKLSSIYNSGVLEFVVGGAIARSILSEEEATPAIMELLKTHIAFARDGVDEEKE
jgi:hypothetical protein